MFHVGSLTSRPRGLLMRYSPALVKRTVVGEGAADKRQVAMVADGAKVVGR